MKDTRKTVFLTGGSTGIGAACVRKFAREGWNVAFMDVNAGDGARLAAEQGVLFLEGDTRSRADLDQAVAAACRQFGGLDCVVANAGILVCEALYIKKTAVKNFCIVDAGMNDLIRPALYNSWMNIIECRKNQGEKMLCDVVGPICESDDFLGRDRKLAVQAGDLLAVRGAGAYGMSMASNYNARRLPCEILVDGDKAQVIRRRQDFADLWAQEELLPF